MAVIELARNESGALAMELGMMNRHGLIAGATGTGKTVTLKVIAEELSLAGVPVFLADIKGDLTSLAKEGELTDKLAKRLASIGVTGYEPQKFPVCLWDVFGEAGHPVRATVSEMGPLLLARILQLNDTQAGILNIVFKIADEKGWLLIDLSDLQALLREVGDNAAQYTTQYGNITKQSVGAIQRSLLVLEQQGGGSFFGEPALDLHDFIRLDEKGQGVVNVLSANRLFQAPVLYSTFLLWMLSELYELLPEVGDLDKPKLVFFFDEAHLLFKDAPRAFTDKIEQVVRLVRSKGVGVFFVTQNPLDLPETVLGQLGNRVQHALRAYTPRELKAVKTAAETFRTNPELDTAAAITELGVGEALVSFLNEKGQPSIVQRAFILPPRSSFDTLDAMAVQALVNRSPMEDKYREAIDRESAREMLEAKYQREQARAEAAAAREREEKEWEREQKERERDRRERERAAARPVSQRRTSSTRRRQTATERAANTFVSTATRTITRELMRGILGSLKK